MTSLTDEESSGALLLGHPGDLLLLQRGHVRCAPEGREIRLVVLLRNERTLPTERNERNRFRYGEVRKG